MTASGLPNSANLHQNYPSTSTGENGDAQREDSPELLRWRADILMDEMMLGAVDVTAGRTSQAYTSAAGYAALDVFDQFDDAQRVFAVMFHPPCQVIKRGGIKFQVFHGRPHRGCRSLLSSP